MSVTWVPALKGALQVVPQLIPPGLLVTVPEPFPPRVTLSTGTLWTGLKVAVTCWLALSVTVQALVPLHPPPVHPMNDEFAPAVAASVTDVPGAKLALQVCPQLMPEGLLATLPVPVPLRVTVNIGEVLKFAVTEVFCVIVN